MDQGVGWSLISAFPAPRAMRNKVLLLTSLSVYSALLKQPEWPQVAFELSPKGDSQLCTVRQRSQQGQRPKGNERGPDTSVRSGVCQVGIGGR